MLKKIVIIGPESTGKSTLSAALAEHYQTVWCPEYARDYLLQNGKQYNYDDLLHIAKGQVVIEDQYVAKATNNMLFVDTDLHVMKVWCEVAYGQCHPWILKEIAERSYHYYLLCNTDLPWAPDELREYPDLKMREDLFKMYYDILVHQQVPWSVIEGSNEERLRLAVGRIDRYLAGK